MQRLAELCVRRPVFTWVLALSVVVWGVVGFAALGVDRYPDIQVPFVVVTTAMPGASPAQIEREVTDRIEEAVNTVAGLERLDSQSVEGASVVMASFVLERDTAAAAQDVRDRVNRALALLPAGARTPRVEAFNPNAAPVITVAVSGPRTLRELTEVARTTVRRRLESLPGVGEVALLGGHERQLRVTLDLVRLEAYGLTAAEVARALASSNVEAPGGTLEQGDRSVGLRVLARVARPAELGELVIARREGLIVRLRDVATVGDADERAASAAVVDGADGVPLAVRKRAGANTVALVDAVRAQLGALARELPPGVRVTVVRDESEFLRNALAAVQEHLALGALLAAAVVLLFLRSARATVIAALAIPVSIVATFALLAVLKLTLNMITLLALTLAVGIVIDDAIVVLENVARVLDTRRLDPTAAALAAVREIGLAVLATTLSLVAVFLPVAFMGGIVGRFLASFGLTMSFAIGVSLLVAFTLTPMLCARWLRRRVSPDDGVHAPGPALAPPGETPASEASVYRAWARGERALAASHAHDAPGALERAYARALGFCAAHRAWVLAAAALVFASTVPLARVVPAGFLPVEDEGRFELTLRAPPGTSLAATRAAVERANRALRAEPGVAHTVTTIGSPPGDAAARGPHEASVYVQLAPHGARRVGQRDAMARARALLAPLERAGWTTFVGAVGDFGASGPDAATVQYVLRGPDAVELERYGRALLAHARRIPGTTDHGLNVAPPAEEVALRVDRARAADRGVTVPELIETVQVLAGSTPVGTLIDRGERYAVVLELDAATRRDAARLSRASVRAASDGGRVALADVTRVEPRAAPSSILRLNRQRQVTVYMNLAAGGSEAAALAALREATARLGMAPGYTGEPAGNSQELEKTARAFVIAIALSVLFMYLVLAAQFESWLLPLSILVSLPLTVPFALLAQWLAGDSLNLFSALGLLVLFGIVKKNSILQVDHIRALRAEGLGRADAVIVGSRDRLRPILMTTLAFVGGMVPLVLSSGAGSGTNRTIGVIVMGGQTLALALTLLATPLVYTAVDDLGAALARLRARLTAAARRIRRWPDGTARPDSLLPSRPPP